MKENKGRQDEGVSAGDKMDDRGTIRGILINTGEGKQRRKTGKVKEKRWRGKGVARRARKVRKTIKDAKENKGGQNETQKMHKKRERNISNDKKQTLNEKTEEGERRRIKG